MNNALIISFIGLLIFLAHLFAGIFRRAKIPDVLMLIFTGLLLGPIFNLISAQQFGVMGSIFSIVTLVIILFEGGIELHFDVIIKSLQRMLLLTVINFIFSIVIISILVFIIGRLNISSALLLAVIVSSISPAVVVPLSRQLPIQQESRIIITIESALSDVLSIIIALGLIEFYKSREFYYGLLAGKMISSFLLAVIIGFLSGFLWSILLNKFRTIQNSIFTTPAFVFIIFGLTEFMGYSGYIAALSFGVILGNIELFNIPIIQKYIPHIPISLDNTEKLFFSEIVFLLKTFFFIYIGISIKIKNLWIILMGLIISIVILLIRILAIHLSMKKNIPIKDVSFMAVMIPKGLAAAVLASIPLQEGISAGELIQDITYSVVMLSIILTSSLIFLIEKTKLAKFYEYVFSCFNKSLPEGKETENMPLG